MHDVGHGSEMALFDESGEAFEVLAKTNAPGIGPHAT
jgi:hypothetical protein